MPDLSKGLLAAMAMLHSENLAFEMFSKVAPAMSSCLESTM